MSILITGGAGYIGSHACIEFLEAGYDDIVVLDNLSNSSEESIKRVEQITGKKIKFEKADILDEDRVRVILKKYDVDAVIHFAGLKAVGESVARPVEYYINNVSGTLILLKVMKELGIKKIVFSSSATVYGDPEKLPITEDMPLSTTNPYGATKLVIEGILKDLYKSDNSWKISILRYFNPIGAHHTGLIGESPNDIPNNLMPYITQVAVGKLSKLSIFGNDYDTHDGTGVRDYIHVVDLAKGHLKALEYINKNDGIHIHNLGTGQGYSVKEIADTFQRVNEVEIKHEVTERRPGDIAACYADTNKACTELLWKAERGIEEMCKDAWNWQVNNPNGYEEVL